jgi:hypothetical protein
VEHETPDAESERTDEKTEVRAVTRDETDTESERANEGVEEGSGTRNNRRGVWETDEKRGKRAVTHETRQMRNLEERTRE